jgi:phosphoribosylglycinamide formyltransferase-1
MNDKYKVVVCASGGGGNFQALIDSRLTLGMEIALLITDRTCGAIDRAIAHDIRYVVIDGLRDEELHINAFLDLIPSDTDLIVLAGFMPIVPKVICDKWKDRIINTHPSLLPRFGGKGMYGVKVQEAVLRSKDTKAGCTVHYVNSEIDGGEIILQKAIDVDPQETAWELGGRVFLEENKLLVAAVKLIKSKQFNRQEVKL